MPAPSNGDELVELVRKSGVVDDSKLANYLDQHRDPTPLPTEPRTLAGQLVQDGILTYFQAEQLLQGKWKRFTIGKYKVLEKLGVGGMGQVFLCEHKLMRRRVAVKVLPVAKGQDDAARGRFYREARAVAALDHPNIVRAYDIDQDENLHFLVMEFVDGVNLQDLSKRYVDAAKKANQPYAFDITRACHYVYAAAGGLQYAASQGIVHRDIKPSNILVDRNGCVKILDMGLARFFENDDEESLTRKFDENVLGTADYLAPEQAIDSHVVDIRADIYALGASFYFLLTGQAPFAEGSVAQKLLWHQTREPKSLKSLRPELPDELIAIVGHMMKKNPEERFQTPAEVMAALQSWVVEPITPPSDDELPRFSLAAVGAPSMANRATAVASAASLSTSELRSPYAKPVRPSTTLPALGPQAVATSSPGVAEVSTVDWSSIGATDAPVTGDSVRVSKPHDTTVEVAEQLAESTRRTRPQPPRSKRRWLLLGGIGVVLAALSGVGVYFAMTTSKPTPPTHGSNVPLDYRTVYVTKGTAPAGSACYKSITQAITDLNSKGAPGATIVLLDERYDEQPFYISRSEKLKDLTIQAESAAKPAVWTLASTSSRIPSILEVRGIEGLRLRNIVFDASGQREFGVSAVGNNLGFTLENVTIRGAKLAALRISDGSDSPNLTRATVAGSLDAARRMLFTNVRIIAANMETGVMMRGDAKSLIQNVELDDVRIEGPARTAIHIDGPHRDILVKKARVFQVQHAVTLSTTAPDMLCKVAVTNSTFHTIQGAALMCEDPLPAKADVTLSRNYFAKTKLIVSAKGPVTVKMADNARDAASGDGASPTKPMVVPFEFPAPQPDDNATFLRYPKGSSLDSVGPMKIAVGYPAE